MRQIKTTIEFWKEGTLYIAHAPELDMLAQGKTMEEARRNLLEVIEIQVEEMQQLGSLEEFLKETGFSFQQDGLISERDRVGYDKVFLPFSALVEQTR